MRVYWWQAGLHLEPQTEAEFVALQRLQEALTSLGSGVDTGLPAKPAAEAGRSGAAGSPQSAPALPPPAYRRAESQSHEHGSLRTISPETASHATGCDCGNCPSARCTAAPKPDTRGQV